MNKDNKKYLIPMKDGGVINISHSYSTCEGCETCGWGSYYEDTYIFILSNNNKEVTIEVEKEYEDSSVLSIEDMMKILLNNMDNIKELYEEEFKDYMIEHIIEYLKNNKGDMNIYSYKINGESIRTGEIY